MSKLKSLKDFFIDELKDLYSAEKQVTKALPKMIISACSLELKNAFQDQLEETENQVQRLEKISKSIGKALKGKKCIVMEGIIEEGQGIIEDDAEPDVRDVALISAAQKLIQYEIASYGSAVKYARFLNDQNSEMLLRETLNEEGNADKTLNTISKHYNIKALEEV